MKINKILLGIFVLVVLASASACTSAPVPQVIAPTVAPPTVISTKPNAAPTAVPTKSVVVPTAALTTLATPVILPLIEIKPDHPLGKLMLLPLPIWAGKIWYDQGLETEYLTAFRNIGPQAFINLVENQLNQVILRYPGVAHGIRMAMNEADVFASDSWATHFMEMKRSGQIQFMTKEMLEEERQEIWTIARAFGLARVYMRLKIVDWVTTLSRGLTGSLNMIPLIFVNPAVLCDENAEGSKMIMFICGIKSGSYSKPL